MKIAIVYASTEGQTARIAHFAADKLGEAGHEVYLADVAEERLGAPLAEMDGAILAAPVHERRHPKTFEAYLSAKRRILEARPTLLLSVSLNAAFPEGRTEAGEYVTELNMRTDFTPQSTELVAGAVRLSRYDYFAAQVVRYVVLRGKGFDPKRDEHEFTDWDALSARVARFAASL